MFQSSLEEWHAMASLCADTTDREQHVIGRKDDPAFLYFPANYRWSMGLLICLGAAPWTGIEIDEVHRGARALEDHVGDDNAWFEEWTRMGDKIEALGRDAEAMGHARIAAAGFVRASRDDQ